MSRLPQDSWQQAWQAAASLAVEALQQADPAERCACGGAVWEPGQRVAEILFLNRRHRIQLPAFAVTVEGQPVSIRERILLLHYLQKTSGRTPRGEWITFAQVPGGELYQGNFRARSADRLVRAFAGREGELEEAGRAVGSTPAGLGDASVLVHALPRVPVAVVLWRGDEEFAPTGNLLFDATVVDHLSAEDMVVLAEMLASCLCRAVPQVSVS
ncbi:MAG: DUF3786 domain-containing protein [Candidatus Latescibacterota bacterium]